MKIWKVRFYNLDQKAIISIVRADTYDEAIECVRETHELGEGGNPFTNVVCVDEGGTEGIVPYEIIFYVECES